jgi:GT2 family glycosyltransferase
MGPAKPLVILEMANGETHTLSAPTASMNPILQRKIIIDHIEERVLDLSLLENIFRPAIAPLHSQINNMQAVERIIEYSSSSMRKVSIVIPLYKNFNFIRSQLFAFSSDPFIRRNCEIIYVNDDPAYGADLISLLEGYRIIFDVDIRLILLQKNGGYSLANNFAVKDANGDVLVLMNSDIVPDGSGWLEGLVKQLLELPKYSVVGPKLLYADNTLQHAGMYFLKHFSGFWQNMHYYKGYGRDFPAANEDRPVGALTGACLVVRKSDFVEVGGFSTEYVIGDYEDSDLCFKLRKMGGICLYSARTALYHFERQSMQSNTLRNDGTTSAYNRALNFSKWKDSGLEAGYLQE